jgi:hypothetical protein
MQLKLRSFTFGFFMIFCQILSFGQNYYGVVNEEFGKNRIQFKRFEWKTIKSNNFEFNFYRGGEEIARKAAKKAESDYDKITETLGYTPFAVMKIFIFNSPEDAKQSNIGLSAPSELDGGILNLTKARIEIAYEKNDSLFYNKLIKEITTLFVYDMLYGGSLKEAMQSQLLLMVPDWFIQGIAGYIAEQNNSERFLDFQTNMRKIESKKLSFLEGKEAQLAGQSLWHYIALKYGKDNISNILNLTRIIRNEQSSITSTLGVSFNRFIKDWKAFYLENSSEVKQELVVSLPTSETNETIKDRETSLILKPGEVDTDDYQFDLKNIQTYKEKKESKEILNISGLETKTERFKRASEELKLSPVKAYQNMLVGNDLNTDFFNDPVRRFGIGSKLILNDLLENHVITLSGFTGISTPLLKNYDYSVQYANFTNKIDYKFLFERRSVNFESINESNDYLFRPLKIFPLDGNSLILSRRILFQKIGAGFGYPLTEKLRVEFNPSYIKTTDIEYELPGRNNLNDFYLSSQLNLVYDKTRSISKSVLLGTRGKVSFEKNLNIGNNSRSFDQIKVDIRHYQKLLKGLVLAGRIDFGRSMGNAPKFSYLGGTENWLNRNVYGSEGQLPGAEGDFRDILFYNFPGNLRGFQFARLFGNNHILTNLELRASLVEYFPRSSLSSTFLRNLQFVLFNDVGTAWNGNKGPFSRQNSLNTILLGADGRSPFFAEVTNFKNPFLVGMGAGIRTTILGLIVKADYGFGREDKEMSKPLLHLSLGADF